jgi:plastocyanin domain-containing protein
LFSLRRPSWAFEIQTKEQTTQTDLITFQRKSPSSNSGTPIFPDQISFSSFHHISNIIQNQNYKPIYFTSEDVLNNLNADPEFSNL